jgi:hypothetical protein
VVEGFLLIGVLAREQTKDSTSNTTRATATRRLQGGAKSFRRPSRG